MPDPEILRADFGISAGVVAVISVLSGLFGLFRGKADKNIAFALDGIRRGILDLGKELANLALRAFGGIAAALAVVRRFLSGFARALWDYIKGIWWHLRELLRVVFTPIIEFLKRIRDHIRRIYTNFVRPILDVIDIMRRFLGVLSVFNVEWAQELDRKLATLVQKINEPFLWVEAKLTWLENWIYRIVTLDGLIQRVALLGALVRDANGMVNIWWSKVHRKATPQELQQYGSPWPGPDVADLTETAKAYIVHRQGPDRARIDEHAADARLRLTRLGY